MDTVIKFLRMLGINRAVSYGVFSRVWGVATGLITMALIAGRFSSEQQGFYFTFSSLLALQIFFELGLMSVISQFASHEFAKLRWKERGAIDGDPVAMGRFLDLLCKSAKWFGVAALLLIVVLVPAGLAFFGQGHTVVQPFAWRLPWVLAVVGTALNLFVTPFFAMIMGSGDVVTVNHRQMVGNIIGSNISWLVIGLGGGLYAVFAVSLGNSIISWSYLIKHKPELLKAVWKRMVKHNESGGNAHSIGWRSEVWPMQWKIALSFGSSYFIFQLFNPVLFHYHGPVVAGQMGMTLSAANALFGVCITWMMVRNPEFGKLIAERQWGKLDRMFFRVFYQSIAVAVAGALSGCLAIWVLQTYSRVGQRFLPAQQAALLLATVVVQIAINGFATYLRAHKQEPLLVMSLVAALLQGTATWLLGRYFSSFGVTAGYFVISLLYGLPTAYFIWWRCRVAWHTLNMEELTHAAE